MRSSRFTSIRNARRSKVTLWLCCSFLSFYCRRKTWHHRCHVIFTNKSVCQCSDDQRCVWPSSSRREWKKHREQRFKRLRKATAEDFSNAAGSSSCLFVRLQEKLQVLSSHLHPESHDLTNCKEASCCPATFWKGWSSSPVIYLHDQVLVSTLCVPFAPGERTGRCQQSHLLIGGVLCGRVLRRHEQHLCKDLPF